MQGLEQLWQYQRAQIALDKFEQQLKSSENYKNFRKVHKFLQEQKKILTNLTQQEQKKVGQIESTMNKMKNLKEHFDKGMIKLEEASREDPEDLIKLRKYFEQISRRLTQEKREFAELVQLLEREDEQLNNMKNALAKASKDYEKLKILVEQEREDKKDEADKLKDELNKREANVEPDLLERFKQARKSYKTPVAMVADNRCTGCLMELPAVLLRKVKEDGDEIIECENCGRMLYYNKNDEE